VKAASELNEINHLEKIFNKKGEGLTFTYGGKYHPPANSSYAALRMKYKENLRLILYLLNFFGCFFKRHI
jgi:hypothetical protein